MRRKGDACGSPAERLARRTTGYDLSTPVVNGSHCLLCSYATCKGYPVMGGPGGKVLRVSRVVWEQSTGTKLAPTQHVLHECDNPACIEFRHLFLGDQSLNVADMVRKQRHQRGEQSGQAKLTAIEVQAIRQDRRTLGQIALQYGISGSTVSDIRLRRTWKHLL